MAVEINIFLSDTNNMNEQPDLFPEDAKEAEERKKTDIIARLKHRHKSTQPIRDLRRLKRRLEAESNAEPRDPNSVIIRPRYKSKHK